MRIPHYTESLPYALESTSRIIHEAVKRFFEESKFEITHDEFVVLDTLYANPGILQIDLAKLILKGRAHTGRFLMSLESKGFVRRTPSSKGKKLIMLSSITDEGLKVYQKISHEIENHIESFHNHLTEEKEQELLKLLSLAKADVLAKYDIKFQ